MSNGNVEKVGGIVTPRLLVGLAIMLFGVVLVLDRLNLAVANQVLQFWPAVIVAAGALIFAQSRRVGGGANGVILMIIGGWLLLNSLGIVRVRFWEMFWPLVLIGIGSVLMMQTLRRRTRDAEGAGVDDTVSIFAVLSGAKRSTNTPRFRGGEVTLFMGGGHIDLSQASIPRGEEAALDIFAVMGGCEIIVPPSWVVATPIVPVLGGIEDKRVPPLATAVESATAGGAAPRLVLRGLVMMGGIVIKS
jgi:predicted membrane protein